MEKKVGARKIKNKDKHVMRVAFFEGYKQEKNSRLITRIYNQYHLLPETFSLNPELSMRTMMNLINLHTIRGNIDPKTKQLDIETSMSGPHHYFGYLEPTKPYTLHFQPDGFPCFIPSSTNKNHNEKNKESKYTIQHQNIQLIKRIIFKNSNPFGCILKPDEFQWISHSQPSNNNSLFIGPGKMWMKQSHLIVPTLYDAHLWDLSLFHVKMIKLEKEDIYFNQEEIKKHIHAQHRLRLISYYYGSKYYDHFCTVKGGPGGFLETHPFIQFITPLTKEASGFILIGRYIESPHSQQQQQERDSKQGEEETKKELHKEAAKEKKSLQLISLEIPYGYCLLVHPYAIHGDANLKGLYLMGMTGNHTAMQTSDTVFLHSSQSPVTIVQQHQQDNQTKHGQTKCNQKESTWNSLFITHNNYSSKKLKQEYQLLERQIYENVKRKLGILSYLFWNASIINPFHYWNKSVNHL